MMLDQTFIAQPLAHRGLHDVRAGRPENSMSAFRAAIAAGYGIELDVQMSRDGVPVVFHDDVLQRLTGRVGKVRDLDADELGALRLTFGSEGVPTLKNVLDVVAGAVPVLIEIKDQDGALGPDTNGLERAVCEVVRGSLGAVALMSFNAHAVAACAEFAPDVPRGLTTDAFDPAQWDGVPEARLRGLAQIADYDRVGACFISHNRRDLEMARVAELQAAGASILCWTVRSVEEEAAARCVAQNITFEGYLPSGAV